MKKFLIILSLVLFVQPSLLFAQSVSNVGLVEHTIWYSKDPFFEGDTIKIYTLLYNSGTSSVSGTVEFYDSETLLGKKDIIIPAQSPKDVSISWTVTTGNHSISAKFLNPTIVVGGKTQPVAVDNIISPEQKFFVPKKVLSESVPIDVAPTGTGAFDSLAKKIEPYTPGPVAKTISAIDSLRDTVTQKIKTSKDTAVEKVDTLKKAYETKKDSLTPTQRPLAYISLFFWTLFSFVFSNKIVFYGLWILVLFLIIRFFWRRSRRR